MNRPSQPPSLPESSNTTVAPQSETKNWLSLEQFEKIQPRTASIVRGRKMVFNTPNKATLRRANSLLEKEPVTIAWLDSFVSGEVLLDIGANVGMYTVYAAVMREVEVYAFEPEGQNYALLNRNIFDNRLGGRVTAYPLAVSDVCKMDHLYLSEVALGGSCHSFGEEVGYNLQPRLAAYRQGAVSITVDDAVRSKAIPVPHHIKIDVDGIEHLVIEGALETLANPKVKSILVELNTNLPEHMAVFTTLAELGFNHDNVQFQEALRTSGPFLGVGEVVFIRGENAIIRVSRADVPVRTGILQTNDPLDKTSNTFERAINLIIPRHDSMRDVMRHVLRRIGEQPIESDPFPHIIVDGIFPDWYYEAMLENFPDEEALVSIAETGGVSKGSYKERFCVKFNTASLARLTPEKRKFWVDFGSWIYSDLFIGGFINKFAEVLNNRLQSICGNGEIFSVRSSALLVSDRTNYAIGPHTDSPQRLISSLFYMPHDESLKEFGTSLYKPKDPMFTCWGGPHHRFENFERTGTLDFLPNRMVAFPKSERCFHGVEPIKRENIDRRLLINDIRVLNSVKY